MNSTTANINHFWTIGINYRKTDAVIRGQFAVNQQHYSNILTLAPQYGVSALFILSTCNRTEIYGMAESPRQLMALLMSQSGGSTTTFSELCYTKNGDEAIDHLFRVAAGLDSQILGDYEILGQIKTSVRFAKEKGFIDAFLERLLNCVLQSSKAIKTKTMLSGGTVSVSFAVIQYIKENVVHFSDKKILLLGTGKIGRVTCKNMIDYLGTKNITLINRTEEKAATLASELGLQYASFNDLDNEIKTADIILVATNAPEPAIQKRHLENAGEKLIIDLSIPCNVSHDATILPYITFINVDDLSMIKDETLQKRQEEVPTALLIIRQHILEFMIWHDMRKHVPLLKEVKNKLRDINNTLTWPNSGHITLYREEPEERIQKVINMLAVKMRNNNTLGCHYIEAINEFIA